jgi:hypothetical protein
VEEDAYLNFSGRHLEFLRELLAPRRIRLLVVHKDALEYLELCRGGALASLDSVRHVGIKHF